MATTGIYLNFKNETEAAFTFYKAVFGGEFEGPVGRMGDTPDGAALAEADKNLVMHVSLPILGGVRLMGSDAPETLGYQVSKGNNVFVSLHPDTRTETDRLFAALAEGGKIELPLQEMFWGDYYGSLTDKFGVRWLFNCTDKG
jgi:PhnB protein